MAVEILPSRTSTHVLIGAMRLVICVHLRSEVLKKQLFTALSVQIGQATCATTFEVSPKGALLQFLALKGEVCR